MKHGSVAKQHSRYPNSIGLRDVVAMPGRRIKTGPQRKPGQHLWRSRSRNYVWMPDRSDIRNKFLGRKSK